MDIEKLVLKVAEINPDINLNRISEMKHPEGMGQSSKVIILQVVEVTESIYDVDMVSKLRFNMQRRTASGAARETGSLYDFFKQ